MRIGLVVDHPKRDLAGVALVAHELSKRGAEALVVPMYEQGVDVPVLDLDAIVVNYARPANKALLESYAAAGIKVYVLDTEGGILATKGGNSPTSLARAIRDGGYGELLSGYFFWGSELRDAFIRERTMPANRSHLTGCPRFDFASPRWRGLLKFDRQDYLLINANFPLVNPRFSGSRDRERAAMIAAGWDGLYIDRLLADLAQVFSQYLATISRLARARPSQDILVRPHPFESAAPYQSALAGISNVSIDADGEVLPVIRNSSAVLHLNCGTAIEAIMLEKLPIQMGFLNTPATAGHAELPAQVSRGVASFQELLDVIDNLPGERDRFPGRELYARHIHRYFHDIDGRAAARVVDVLAGEVATRPSRRSVSLYSAVSGSRARPSAGQMLKGLASTAFGSAATSALRARFDPRRRDKAVTMGRLRELVARIAEHERTGETLPKVVRARARPLGVPLATLRVTVA